MAAEDICPVCDLPITWDEAHEGAYDTHCLRTNSKCRGEPVDWRARALAAEHHIRVCSQAAWVPEKQCTYCDEGL